MREAIVKDGIARVCMRKENVDRLLAKMNRSENWLAYQIMMPSGHLSQILFNKRPVSAVIRHRIMKVLKGVDWDYLFKMEDKSKFGKMTKKFLKHADAECSKGRIKPRIK